MEQEYKIMIMESMCVQILSSQVCGSGSGNGGICDALCFMHSDQKLCLHFEVADSK
jgi:hypothetical protein